MEEVLERRIRELLVFRNFGRGYLEEEEEMLCYGRMLWFMKIKEVTE